MCSGQNNPIPNTHSTLTATLVLPPSGLPTLLPPTPPKTTLLTSSTSKGTRTTSRTRTSSPSLTSTSKISSETTSLVMSSFSTSTSSSSSTSASALASGPTPSATSEPSSTTRLAPAQIAGITVGIAGAIAIAGGAILLARCMRRRRYPDYESEKPFFEHDNGTGSSDPFGPRGSRIFHISPPMLRTSRYRPDFTPRVTTPAPPPATQGVQPTRPVRPVRPERPIQPTNIDRSTIGLAITRPRSLIPPKLSPKMYSPAMSSPRQVEVSLERKPSKLLPPRPALTIEIPPSTVVASAPTSQEPLLKDRASTMTNMTAFADLDAEATESEQVWRPPPTDPQSATTLYVADKYGNWVLSNSHRQSQIAQVVEAVELDTYTLLTKSPIEKQEEAEKMAATVSATTVLPRVPQPAFLFRDPANRTNSQSSSLYSQGSAVRQTGRRTSSGRNSGPRPRKSSGGVSINRSDSKASATTIQTSSTGGNDDGFSRDNDIARLSQLSPVEESPTPATRRSRVTYPRIPGRLDGATIRYVPPPKRPHFAAVPLAQPSPTLGIYPVEGSPSAYPLPLNPRRNERTGSGFTPDPPNIEVFPLQNLARSGEAPRPGPPLQPDSTFIQPTKPYGYINTQRQDQPRRPKTPTRQSIPTFTPSPLSAEKTSPSPPPPGIMARGRPHVAFQRVVSGTSFRTVSSTASSLLAKRIGTDRAATFALDPKRENGYQWKQGGGGNLLSPDLVSPRGTLPQTPIWKPKLTPTRRGDDLFLNVQ